MNVTVHVPAPLREVMEGRRKVELGLPASANLGDLLETLFSLYPKLRRLLPHEGVARTVELRLLLEPRHDPLRLREGQPIYLVADQPRRLADQATEG